MAEGVKRVTVNLAAKVLARRRRAAKLARKLKGTLDLRIDLDLSRERAASSNARGWPA